GAERAQALGLPCPDGNWLAQCLGDQATPVVAVSDYVRAVPEQIRAWVPGPYRVLGTDGFGHSDTRARLRDFFEVGAPWIVLHALDLLAREDSAWQPALQARREQLQAATRNVPSWQS
ncbi:transketolase-like TK C-terminal-containing protein, partial [Bordetella pertussis]